MRITSLSSEFSTEQLASGQLESSGDLVGERALHAMEFSPPLEEEEGGTSGAQVTSTLEPSSPENVEPVEPEVTLFPRAEPEISELSPTVSLCKPGPMHSSIHPTLSTAGSSVSIIRPS